MVTVPGGREKSSGAAVLPLLLAFLFLSRDSRDVGLGASRVHFLLLVVNELEPGRGRPPDKYGSARALVEDAGILGLSAFT